MNYIIHANGMSCANRDRHRSPGTISIKAFFIMKLIVILTICFYFHSLANTKAQQVNIDVKNASFKTVVQLIQQQTGYSFAMNERFLQMAKPVTAIIKGKDLKVALPIIFKEQPFGYTIDGRIISLVPKSNDEERKSSQRTHQQTIHGRVTDSLGNPLEGVTVVVKGTGRQVITDKSGQYEIPNVEHGSTLIFRLLSFESLEITATQPKVDAVLKMQYSILDEAEVRGYYSTTKKLSTGNARTITSEDISTQPVGNPLLTLQGRIAGLTIEQRSGNPGRNVNVAIRGRNSIANGNDPLYVIDGIPFNPTSLMSGSYIGSASATGIQSPLNSINPDDIESITILKDADATAIYGSMGANGVILINTKRGRIGTTQLDFDYNIGYGKISSEKDLLNTGQYLEIRDESFENSNMTPGKSDYDINGTWDRNRYTDWQEVLIGNTAKTTASQIRLSGGGEFTQFTLGGGYFKETTVYPGDYYDNRISFQSAFNHRSRNGKFNGSVSVNYSNNRNEMPVMELAGYITLPPNTPPIYNSDGSLNWENETWLNPLAWTNSTNRVVTDNYMANGLLAYKVTKDLNAQVAFGFNQMALNQDVLIPNTVQRPSRQNLSRNRQHNNLNNNRRSWIIEPQIAYKSKFGSSTLEALVGTTFRENLQTILGINARDFVSDDLIKNIHAAATTSINFYDKIQYRYNAVYARIGYNWNEKYILNLTGRRDGSSRFGPGKKFGNFGAIGAAWILSEERFLKAMPTLNFAKLRVSYGITGNDQLTDYEYLSTYSVDDYTYLNSIGLTPTRIANPDYGWESVKKFEIGFDLGIFDSQLQLNSSWYQNRTENQLVGYPLPNLTGFNTVRANLPAVVQNRGFELEFIWQPTFQGILKWSASGNISFPRNKLLSYPDFQESNYRNTYKIGESMFGGYQYIYDGIDEKTGSYTFQDLDGDNAITSDDRAYFSTQQNFHGGITNNFSIKQINLSFHIQFVDQPKVLDYMPPIGMVNNYAMILDRWRKENDSDKWQQRLSRTFNNETNYFMNSNRLIFDSQYFRLKNVVLGYNLKAKYLQQVKIQKFEVYLEGQNLMTLSGFPGGDPESLVGNYIPPIRMFVAGIKVGF